MCIRDRPQNGLDFQLDELQKFVDGYIDIINLHNGDILVINDNWKTVVSVGYYRVGSLVSPSMATPLTTVADISEMCIFTVTRFVVWIPMMLTV